MTRLGRFNPLLRIGRTVIGLFHRPDPAAHEPREAAVIAHRGAAHLEPENTVAAFVAAMELGADAIETDICVTRDGHFVLWHDADPDDKIALARQGGAEGSEHWSMCLPDVGTAERRRVCELDLRELRQHFCYVRKVGNGKGERVEIPILDELFDWARADSRVKNVYLDVKLLPDQIGAALRLLSLVAECAPTLRDDLTVHFLSPQAEVVEALAAQARREPLPARVHLTADFELPGALERAERLGLKHVSMGCGARSWADFRLELAEVAAARHAGRVDSVTVWTVNTADQLKQALAFGVDGVMTDEPALLRQLVSG
ncbi:MAG: glycerophosphodiester phosphodiesterase family protein [Thermoanaerobaculia bacterium]